jgi:hypothetical protein
MIDQKDVVAWSAKLTSYAQVGDCDCVTNVFIKITIHGLRPNEFVVAAQRQRLDGSSGDARTSLIRPPPW